MIYQSGGLESSDQGAYFPQRPYYCLPNVFITYCIGVRKFGFHSRGRIAVSNP